MNDSGHLFHHGRVLAVGQRARLPVAEPRDIVRVPAEGLVLGPASNNKSTEGKNVSSARTANLPPLSSGGASGCAARGGMCETRQESFITASRLVALISHGQAAAEISCFSLASPAAAQADLLSRHLLLHHGRGAVDSNAWTNRDASRGSHFDLKEQNCWLMTCQITSSHCILPSSAPQRTRGLGTCGFLNRKLTDGTK